MWQEAVLVQAASVSLQASQCCDLLTQLPAPPCCCTCCPAEMRLHGGDVWGHFAPMFHLVDVFAIYAMTLLGARHVILPTFNPADALLTMGEAARKTPDSS